jgi:hypothetical protein
MMANLVTQADLDDEKAWEDALKMAQLIGQLTVNVFDAKSHVYKVDTSII